MVTIKSQDGDSLIMLENVRSFSIVHEADAWVLIADATYLGVFRSKENARRVLEALGTLAKNSNNQKGYGARIPMESEIDDLEAKRHET